MKSYHTLEDLNMMWKLLVLIIFKTAQLLNLSLKILLKI